MSSVMLGSLSVLGLLLYVESVLWLATPKGTNMTNSQVVPLPHYVISTTKP